MEPSRPAEASAPFQFKQFAIAQDRCTMKVGTDGVLLGAWAPVLTAQSILDIGAGTGVVAIMLAQRQPQAQVDGVEIDEAAAAQANANMAASPWAARLHTHHQSIQDFARTTEQRYDLIVSNPPFFTGGTFSDNQDRHSVRHTVKLPHSDLLQAVRHLLVPQGRFCLILPYLEGLRFKELALAHHLYCTAQTAVHPTAAKPVERLLLEFSGQEGPCEEATLVIQHPEGRNNWTDAYIALTRDFYLHL